MATTTSMHKFANPKRFVALADRVLPWCAGGSLLLLLAGLYFALFASPPDYQQGDTVRIMYLHVPAAILASGIYFSMAAASASFLIWRHPLGDTAAQASAPIGAAMTLLTLVTGALWGKPMWGAWWVWDARLTSVLVLFFLYLGYIALAQSLPQQETSKKTLAALVLIGTVNLPIIKFSVEWWNTLHQPASLSLVDDSTIAEPMLWPLRLMIPGFALFYVSLLLIRMKSALLRVKIRRLRNGRG